MVTWRNRVKITVLALASAVGTWIVYDTTRDRMKVVDEAEFGEAIMERYAALTYATNVATVVGWTSIRYATNGTVETWGGYSNVVIDIASDALLGDGDDLDGDYLYAYRARGFEGFAADRGFMDVYTNGAYVLLDLGPSGGGKLGRRVGGWALTSDIPYFDEFALPRGFGLSSAWFLNTFFTPELLAFGYDPADNAATPGGIDPARRTYWEPGTWYTVTNEAAQTPLRHDRWYRGAGAYTGWETEDYQTPLVIWPTVSPFMWPRLVSPYIPTFLTEQIWTLLPTPVSSAVVRSYVDFNFASDGLTDFDGWTNQELPSISSNSTFSANRSTWFNHVDYSNTATYSRPAFTAMGRALMDLQSLNVEAYWTNTVSGVYYSGWFTNNAAGWADMLADPGWTTNPPVLPADDPPYPTPAYELRWGEKGSDFYLVYTFTQATPVGMLGRAHNTNVWQEATAHYWSGTKTKGVPDGETVVSSATNRLVRLLRESSMPGPLHTFGVRVPSFTNSPPSSFFPSFDEFTAGWSSSGYHLGEPIVVAAPVFDVPRIE